MIDYSGPLRTGSLKTNMAIAISKAIGIDDTVKRFDEIRVKLKSQKLKQVKLTRQQVQEHDQLMANLQLKVVRKKSELKVLKARS